MGDDFYHNFNKPPRKSWIDILFKLNVHPVVSGFILGSVMAILILALCLVAGGCAYSVIPTASLDRAKEAGDIVVDEGDKAAQRSADYKAEGNLPAAAEANRLAQIGKYADRHILKPLEEGKTIGDSAKPLGDIVIAAAQSNPWTAGIATIAAALIPALGIYGGIKSKQASNADAAHAWEESISSDSNYGPVGSIDFDSPEVKAKALSDAATGKLKPGALKRIYPQG